MTSEETVKPQPKIGQRHSYDDAMDFLQSPEKMRAGRMTRDSHPGWMDALEELSAKAGVRPPALYHIPTHRINAFMGYDALIFTDGFLGMAGSHARDLRPSKNVLMVMAHELGHRKQGYGRMIIAPFTLAFAMPLAAMAALHLYDQAQAKKKNQTKSELAHSVNQATDETIDVMKKTHSAASLDDESSRQAALQWKESLIHTGRYLLAGVLGLSLGLAGSRALVRNLEFDADRMAVTLTKDPEGYIDLLKKMHEAGGRQFAEELVKKPRLDHMGEKVQDYLSTQWKKLMGDTLHAHPSMKEREAFIRRSFSENVAASRQGVTLQPGS